MLYGRDGECERLGVLLQEAWSSKSAALVVRGEPGIGKSALLNDTRQRAEGMTVLTARGVEAESELPFGALHQLLRAALPLADRLPEPQRNALCGALGLEDAAGTERFLVSAACLSLLSELAEEHPVLCLVDDAHWLDTATADALLFVARRLDAEGIVMLFGAREGDVRTFEAEGVESLVLEPLDESSSAVLLERAAGVDVSPAVLERLFDETNGNPLALLEVPAALSAAQLAGNAPLPEALPMTTRLEQIYLERFRRLPPAAQRMLLAVASDDSEELRIVIAAARALDASEKDLDVAERSGLVSVNGTRVEFRHPLVRSAIYSAATSGERREVHGAFAAALRNGAAEEDRRAWHLANSVVDTDDEIAQILEDVADRAESRGAYASAARTLQRAVDLSADHAARARRLVRAATDASNAGLDDEAVALARRAQDVVVAPELRAEIASVLGLHELRRGTPIDAYPMLLEAANDVAQIEPAKAIELLMYALSAASTSGNDLLQLEASSAAAKVPRPEDDDARMLATLVAGFGADVDGDLSRTASILKPAIEMAYDAKDSYVILLRSIAALVVGDDARYEELLTRSIATARERGRLGVLAEALAVRASQLFMLQRYDEAHQAAKEALEFGREVRAENHMLMPLGVIAAVAAFRGDDDEARRTAEAVIEAGTAKRLPVRAGFGHYVLGMLDFVQGRWESALGRFEFVAALSTVHAMRVAPDRVEAGLRAGRREEAADITASFERWTEQLGASWGRPRAMSCRALLSEGDEATAYFEEAIADIDAARPFDRARIHLLYGEHLRRARQRAEARTHLHIALKEFDRFGALPWANRATAELRATGETVRKRDPDTLDKLTPQEIQISRLVAEGMSNKEVAALLFLSPRTIEYHLRSVFSKLGLTSRTQLARVDLAVYDAPAPSAVGAAS